MNRLLAILILWSVAGASFGQMPMPFPTVDGKINFSEVVHVDGASKDDLYERAKIWFANAFVSSNSVIQLDNKEGGLIMGKGVVVQKDKHWGKSWKFTIKLQMKDGRYKVEIYDLYYSFVPDLSSQTPNMATTLSPFEIKEYSLDVLYADRKRMYNRNGDGLKKGFSTILATSTNTKFNSLLASLEEQLTTGVALDDF